EAVSFHDRMVVLFVGIVHMVFVFALRQLMIRFKQDCHAITDLQKSVSSLVEANVAGQRYAATIEDESVEAERNRITREIHDSLGYTLTNIVMLMEAAKDLAETDRERLDEFLDFARGQALDGLAETRRTLREYRAIAQPELNIITAVNRLVRMVNATTSVAVKVDYSNILWTFGNTIDEVLYRVVQEGLTNAIRHGNATRVDVLFWCDAQRIHLTVRDNGRGGANIIDGIGLSGMRERLRGLGGELTTNSSPKGFRLAVEIPDYRKYQ
ncbi:MAG: sensor histidine kinase, partial [Sedimentisphaerales bacterium]|nr:sensor histidine kinase [Sedimentisphaerales bacterium]